MSAKDILYYERRAREEAWAAERATSAAAASAHRLLALEYDAHARELRHKADRVREGVR